MAFDGCFLYKTVSELQAAVDSHVDKIYQPSKNELVFLLRKKGFAERLLIHLGPGAARLHFTQNRFENPAAPPMFCMLLRKYLSAAKLLSITQPGTERIAELHFAALNEMGDAVTYRLVCELLGNKTNLLLVGGDGKILDALRRSDPESADRLILPGAPYEYPAGQQKKNPLVTPPAVLAAAVCAKSGDPAKALLDLTDGFSPLICREAVYRAGGERLTEASLTAALTDIVRHLTGSGDPAMLIKPDGTPADFSYMPIHQYGQSFEVKRFASYSALLDGFYSAKENAERLRTAASDILRLVSTLRARTEKKLALRLQELKQCENREHFRIYGELIKANLYQIQNGDTSITVPNFYDDLKPITIPLDPALSPQKNAARYFKEYKKTYTAEQTLTALTQKDREELLYFEAVSDSIARAETTTDIAEIREELTEAGYGKRTPERRKNAAASAFREYTSVEGYRIAVGKNNRQNDRLTTVLAAKNDLWFHVKSFPGSHVVVFCHGEAVSEETLLFAAKLAAANSKAANSSNVPVDYTPVKYVKKPAGAKPGMVIYTTNKTLYVDPR